MQSPLLISARTNIIATLGMMSNGDVRKVSPQDLQLVQNLIERCLQLYMSQKEVVNTLLHQAKIEPSFTELVWQKLEEENQEFFKAYHLRLTLKDQIMKFNKLLQTQAELMRQISPIAGAVSIPISNESHVPLMHRNPSCFAPNHTEQNMKPENMHQSTVSNRPNTFSNGGSCMNSTIDMSSMSRRNIDTPNMVLGQNVNMEIMRGMNGEDLIKTESGYGGGPSFIYNADGNGLERNHAIAPIVSTDTSSFGFLGQIPRNFSLSDLTADFSVSSDILDSYSRSPYLGIDADNYLNPHGNGDLKGDGKRLDTISEGLSYEGFGSD